MRFSIDIALFMILLFVQSFCIYGQETSNIIYHIVRSNENVYRMSLRYKVPIDSIQTWNNLNQDYTIRVGQQLIVSSRKFVMPSDQLTSDNDLVQVPDTSNNLEKTTLPDSLLTANQTAFLPVYSESVENDGISTFSEKVLYYYHKSNYIFRIILFMNFIFLVSVFVLFIVILSRRLRNGYIEFKRNKCQDRYRDYITDWLYEEHSKSVPDSLKKELKDWVNREVFTSELLSLHTNLTGESAEKLIDLFHLAGLQKYTIRKVHHLFWHVKAKGFRELAQMKIKEGNSMIFKCLNSGNTILRIEAQLAWIQLNPDDPLSFYDDPKVQLTEWGQLNSLLSLKKSVEIPDFGRWLKSEGKRVSLFALKMSGIYKQFDNADLVIQRLGDTDCEIRREAICTLGKMAMPSQAYELQQQFMKEEPENKTEIIRSLIMMSDTSNIPFFEKVLLNETDINLRILSAKGLVSLDGIGADRLDSLYLDADQVLKNIITHAKDNRI